MERILLVEDDAQITASLSAFLQSEGFSVETATGETQARQLVEQTAPGLLLVDVQLAEGSGFGVCAYARSRGLPVIFLTASGDESSVVLGLDMGADDYIAKPFRPRELVSRGTARRRRWCRWAAWWWIRRRAGSHGTAGMCISRRWNTGCCWCF